MQVLLRGETWRVLSQAENDSGSALSLLNSETGKRLEVLCPPDEYTVLPDGPPQLTRQSLAPFRVWQLLYEALRLASPQPGIFAAFHAGRLQLEPYQLVPVARLLASPRRNLLIADDVGLGKTIEAGICLLELAARGVGRRVLLVVPPGLIPQWIDEMREKFGLEFQPIEDSASLDAAQMRLADGVQPWAFFDRIITSTEYLKRRDVHAAALARPWDMIVVDEAHYLAESGTPANPYDTLRSRLGPKLRAASRSLLLLTATPHNGHRHSFRSLLELVEPTDATLAGAPDAVRRRVSRSMVRRLKAQITRTGPGGARIPAFVPRAPVERIEVRAHSAEERDVFRLVSDYCRATVEAVEESAERDLVSFAMQIVKKRMLSSRLALQRTVAHRLEALASRSLEDGPTRSELRELRGDLPLGDEAAERLAHRVLRSGVAREARRRNAERRKLKEIQLLLERLATPDAKLQALAGHLEATVLSEPGEKAIIFTEYRDSLEALRESLAAQPRLAGAFVELTGGLTPRQRLARIARFENPDCRVLLATDAASEGLNLQRYCRRLYHFELPWNPNRLEQRNGRIDRHGQTRPPVIAYLHYADSPEDRVLDRLIQRIAAMHDDRVSTPDILGALSATRLEQALGTMPPGESDAVAAVLLRVFEEATATFARDLGPLLAAGAEGGDLGSLDPYSADPLVADDLELERYMEAALGSSLRPGSVPHTVGIEVPRQLQGAGVLAQYSCVTFRRSVAVQYPAGDVTFVHRLHPLFLAMAAQARETLGGAMHPAGAPKVAVRRHRSAVDGAFVAFTFLHQTGVGDGSLLTVGLTLEGVPVNDDRVRDTLRESEGPAGEVPWAEVTRQAAPHFERLAREAGQLALTRLEEGAARERENRARTAELLRTEAAGYRDDRLEELEQQEAAERAGARDQVELFRDAATNWAARRAAVATHYEQRLREIDAWAAVPPPQQPQPLGALLVFPEE